MAEQIIPGAPSKAQSSNSSVIVQVDRLPQNIGDMMRKYLAGELVNMHVIAVTKDQLVIRASTEGIPDYIRQNDDF